MFGTLFVKECRQTAKSLIYWLIVVILALFFFSQLGDMAVTSKPKEGQEDYGFTHSKDKEVIMESTLECLAEEYSRGQYSTYPIGFYKSVKLNDKDSERIKEILEEAADITDYERFLSLMEEVDDILGGGSSYAEDMVASNAVIPMTYEDAMEEYENLVEKERLTGGYARLFSDYMGIMLSILPVFLAVTRGLRDRRAQMEELIAVRRASSAVIIGSRYLAMIVMMMIPVLLLSIFPLAECMKYAASAGISVDYFAFVKYSLGWLMPSVMTAAAVGLVITVLTDTAAGVLVQGIWWFIAIFSSMSSMSGGAYGWSLVPRHNTVGNYEGFKEQFLTLAANRALYAALSIVLVITAMWIYSQKRKGRLNIRGKIHANRKNEPKA